MNIDLLFQIAGVGILIFAVDLVAQLLNNVKSIFGLY